MRGAQAPSKIRQVWTIMEAQRHGCTISSGAKCQAPGIFLPGLERIFRG